MYAQFFCRTNLLSYVRLEKDLFLQPCACFFTKFTKKIPTVDKFGVGKTKFRLTKNTVFLPKLWYIPNARLTKLAKNNLQ